MGSPSDTHDVAKQSAIVRILAVSDIHAFDSAAKGRKGKEPPSYVDITKTDQGATDRPLVALEDLVDGLPIRADVVICCGDLGDGADPVGIKFAWDFLNKLK